MDQAWLLRPFVGIREWVPGLGESLVPFHIHAPPFLMLPGVPGGGPASHRFSCPWLPGACSQWAVPAGVLEGEKLGISSPSLLLRAGSLLAVAVFFHSPHSHSSCCFLEGLPLLTCQAQVVKLPFLLAQAASIPVDFLHPHPAL